MVGRIDPLPLSNQASQVRAHPVPTTVPTTVPTGSLGHLRPFFFESATPTLISPDRRLDPQMFTPQGEWVVGDVRQTAH
ncbi:unnamed protein product [Protopolystoma xenopodis]|uniref:Uncharacterized protein n=1 Tax=Protopolystoma xenopodis TaxID=117903 RepID=A0A3S5B1U9_9PLAT|nr:unnamed protein product [Protopolystoma xenopodis]